MTRFLFLALIIGLLASNSALASDIKPIIKPVIAPTGKLAFCIAEHKYPNNQFLAIGYSPKGKIYISATIPKAGFKPKAHYDLKLMLGSNFTRKVRARATNKETLLIDMGARANFRKALIASTDLKLSANGNIIPFKLPNMMTLLNRLKKCADQTAEHRSAPTQKNTSTQEQTFPSTLMALLNNAGFTSIVPLSMEDIPLEKRPADYIWETDSLLAGVRTRKAPENETLTSLIGLHIKGLRLKCKGSFSARIGRKEVTSGRELSRATATCSPYEGKIGTPVSVALLFLLSPKNDFTVFTHEAEVGKQANALAARDKLAKHVLSLK